ncbi:MAG: hypothetical protein K5769_10440 [Pseudobutyrivibrio sp.]|nr:hypothetical protein [Pseudobutyrivibrio sp.]
MKQTFWAKIAFKNIFENKKFHLANLIVSIFTVTTLYLYVFMTTNPGLKNATGYPVLLFILYMGCFFLSVVTLVFKSYTNKIFIKRRNKELGLYAVWGLESKHINRILSFEALYMYLASVGLGLIIGVISQRFIYETLFSLMKCNAKYQAGFMFSNLWITMIIIFVIDFLILLKNMKTIKKQQVITLLKEEDSNKVVKKLKATDIIKGMIGMAMIVGVYIYVNTIDDFLNSISTIFVALIILFIGSYLTIACFIVMIEFFLKKKDGIYYKNRFFTTIAKLISKTKNNALSLAVINILFTCVVLGASTTIALYLGTDRQASEAYKVDGEIGTTNRENLEKIEEAIHGAAEEIGVKVESIQSCDSFGFPTLFDEVNGVFSYDVKATKPLPELVRFIDLEDFNKNENTNLTLEDNETFFITDADIKVDLLDNLDVHGKRLKVKKVLQGPIFIDIDNIKYMYTYTVVVKDFKALEDIEQYINNIGINRKISHTISYNISGNRSDEEKIEKILEKKINNIGSISYFATNTIERKARYERNAIFLFLGAFISLIFVMYMIFIMYYKQIQEAVDDVGNVKIMQKIGMSAAEVKKSIMAENGILFFIPIGIAFIHVVACYKIICDILKLFMLTDMDFARICIIVFSLAIFIAYTIMYSGAYKVYTNIVLRENK